MAILAGIDEAGYGPLLGPLVVSGAAFRVPDSALKRCLWKTLRRSCSARVQRNGQRLVIADSKKLHRPPEPLALLERAALVMLSASGRYVSSWRGLLDGTAPGAAARLDAYPWYAGADLSLALCEATGDIATRANAVRSDWNRQGVGLHGVFCEPVEAGEFNRLIERTGNKGVVSLSLVLRLVERILRSASDRQVSIIVDRQGGRLHYREALMTSWPGDDLRILEESFGRSAYRLSNGSRTVHLEFLTNGENRHFCTALASIYSKYVRELSMHAFNRYWSREVPFLRPTAGYYTDALRWLNEAGPELNRRAVDRARLVRHR